MPNWKKVITSGSDAALNGLIVTNNLRINASGSSIISGSFVVTGSSQIIGPISVTGNQTIDGNILVIGNITAQQYIVSSSVYYVTQSFSSGSTVFGNSLDDTHQFTGSLYVTGSIIATNGFTGSLQGTGSWAQNALTASFLPIATYQITASVATNAITASYVTGSVFTSANPALSASFAVTASHALNVSPPVTINNNTDNFIVTATGTSLTVQGEPNFRFNGSLLQLTGSAIISGTNASLIVSGTVSATNGFTGNLTGTSSWATVSRRILMGVVGTLPSGPGETIYYLPVTRNLPVSTAEATLLAQTSSLIYSGSLDRLFVTASWAVSSSFATTAGFALTTNIATASYVNALTQNVIISGSISTRISSTDLQNLSATANSYSGNTVQGTAGSVGIGDLCYLDFNTPAWEPVDQTTDSSTKLLGICVDTDTGHFLLDGKFTLTNSVVGGTLRRGYPVYLNGTGQFTTDVASLTTGYVRIVGHLLDTDGSNNWLLNFRPDHTWIQL